MKKILLLIIILSGLKVHATIFTVNVSSNQFSPQNIPNVVVGDVVKFVYVNGFHTTTCNPGTEGAVNSLPPGASPWDVNMQSAGTTFSYNVTAAGSYVYYCKIHGVSMSGSFTASSPAPVTLSEFNVSTANNKPALLWTTQTEINTSYFSIRKSNDGTNYTEIARVPAAGTSSAQRSYNFTDNSVTPNEKYVYYLLATVDLDGSKHFSDTRLFKNPLAIKKLITLISPNPISKPGHLLLKFNADKPGIMLVKVINMQGKTVLNLQMDAFTGINNGHVHMGDMPSGTYTIQFNLNSLKETYKVMVK